MLIALAATGWGETLPALRGVWQAEFNDDGSRVVVQLRSGAASLWDTVSGAAVCASLGREKETSALVLRPDHKAALVTFRPTGAQIVSLANGEALSPLLDFKHAGGMELDARFSPDQATLVVVGDEYRAHVFETETGKPRVEPIPLAGTNPDDTEVQSRVKFSADGAKCGLMDSNGRVFRHDARTWKQIGKPVQHPHREGYSFGFDFSADGKWLATFDGPGENGPKGFFQMWNAETGKAVGAPVSGTNGIAAEFLVEPDRLLRQPGRGGVVVTKIPSGETVFSVRRHDEIDSPSVAVSPDGRSLISWGPDRFISLQDGRTGKHLGGLNAGATVTRVLFAPDSATCFIVFDNSAFLVQGHYDQYVMRVSLPKMEIEKSFRVLDFVARVALSPDGRRMIVVQGATDEERVRVLDTGTMEPLAGFEK
ncbi:MAG: WD40 repeat domain-containing protein [Chthoniobacter sp.]|nr:WD40 repeat domain-containing protein [Chthoniobacter sp.]